MTNCGIRAGVYVKFIVISIAMAETSTKQTEYMDCVGYFLTFQQVLAGIVPKLLHDGA